jgi:hypothetical protein
MKGQGLHDPKGELFAYLEGNVLYTLEGEATGRLELGYIVDIAGNRLWRVDGDGVYSLETEEAVGYFSSQSPSFR